VCRLELMVDPTTGRLDVVPAGDEFDLRPTR
jgi:hypothetical protein